MPKYSVNITSYDAFRADVIGIGFDIDGSYGYQCWDGVDLLYTQVGMTLLTGVQGYAKECWTVTASRNANGSDPFEIVEGVENIKRGDIVVLNSGGTIGTAGHIAFADEDYSGNTINLLGQNQSSGHNAVTGTPFSVNSLPLTTFLGIFRYKPWSGSTPTPTVSKNKKKFPWAVAWNHWNAFKR